MASLSLPWRPLSQAVAIPKSSYRIRTRSFPLRSSRLVSTPRSPRELFFLNFVRKRRLPLLGSRVPNLEEKSVLGLEVIQMLDGEAETRSLISKSQERVFKFVRFNKDMKTDKHVFWLCTLSCGITSWLSFAQVVQSSEGARINIVYEIGELFELGIQLFYLLILLGLLGVGTFFVIRQVLVRRELDLSAKELQEQVRSGDATATEYFELGAVMLRRKFYPAAAKYLQQAIEKWDRDDQDLAQAATNLDVDKWRKECKREKYRDQRPQKIELLAHSREKNKSTQCSLPKLNLHHLLNSFYT